MVVTRFLYMKGKISVRYHPSNTSRNVTKLELKMLKNSCLHHWLIKERWGIPFLKHALLFHIYRSDLTNPAFSGLAQV
jgi:hypothetical protein